MPDDPRDPVAAFGAPALSPPPTPSGAARRRRLCRPVRQALAVVAAVALAGSLSACGGDDDDSGSTTTEAPGTSATGEASTTVAEGDVHAVGDTTTSGDLGVTVLQVEDPYVSSAPGDEAAEGNRFVAAEVELTNDLTAPFTWTATLLAALTDSSGEEYPVSFSGADLEPLDGDVPAGGSRTGWLLYEVPEDASGLRLAIQGGMAAAPAVYALD